MSSLPFFSHAFIVRIWWEKHEDANNYGQWRGMVEYVPTSQRRYFHSFDTMIAFIGQCAEIPEDENTPPPTLE